MTGITAIIAIYGAVLSTIQLLWKVRPNVTIKSGPSVLSNEMPSNVYIKTENHGQKPVKLTMPRFKIVKDEKTLIVSPMLYWPELTYPYELQAGQSLMFHIPMHRIVALLKKHGYGDDTEICAICNSEIGKTFTSKSKISVNDMKKFIERISKESVAEDIEGIW